MGNSARQRPHTCSSSLLSSSPPVLLPPRPEPLWLFPTQRELDAGDAMCLLGQACFRRDIVSWTAVPSPHSTTTRPQQPAGRRTSGRLGGQSSQQPHGVTLSSPARLLRQAMLVRAPCSPQDRNATHESTDDTIAGAATHRNTRHTAKSVHQVEGSEAGSQTQCQGLLIWLSVSNERRGAYRSAES